MNRRTALIEVVRIRWALRAALLETLTVGLVLLAVRSLLLLTLVVAALALVTALLASAIARLALRGAGVSMAVAMLKIPLLPFHRRRVATFWRSRLWRWLTVRRRSDRLWIGNGRNDGRGARFGWFASSYGSAPGNPAKAARRVFRKQ